MKHTLFFVFALFLVGLSATGCKKEKLASLPSYQIKMDKDQVYVGDTVLFYADVIDRGAYYAIGKYDWKMSGVETSSATISITDPYNCAPMEIGYKVVIKKSGNHSVSMSATFQFLAPSPTGQLYGSVTAKGFSFVAHEREN